jgi:predicted PurR-regulated permease PerM
MTKLRKASLLSHKQQQHITNTSRSKNIGSDVHNKERSFRIIYVLFLICFPIMIFVGGNLNSQLANLKNYVPKSTYHDDGMSKIVPNETPYSELGQSVEPSIPTEKQKRQDVFKSKKATALLSIDILTNTALLRNIFTRIARRRKISCHLVLPMEWRL